MTFENFSYVPRVLSLISTYRCTASCVHCCFECSPTSYLTMNLDMIEHVISQSQGFKKLSISGGEPFLDLDLLSRTMEVSRTAPWLETRAVVTNCFWAQSEEKAIKILNSLKNAGLNLLGTSCDSYHQKFISIQNVANAVKASIKLDISVQVNIMSPYGEFSEKKVPEIISRLAMLIGETSLRTEYFLDYAHAYKGEVTGIFIFQGGVMPVGRARDIPSQDIGSYDLTSSWKNACILQPKWKNFSTDGQVLTILPDYRCFPCCSLYAPSGHLMIGNSKEESLSDIINNANSDNFIRFISTMGLPEIRKIIERHFSRYRGRRYSSICDFCFVIKNDSELKEILR